LGKVEGHEEVKAPVGVVSAFEVLSEEVGIKEVCAFPPTTRGKKKASGHVPRGRFANRFLPRLETWIFGAYQNVGFSWALSANWISYLLGIGIKTNLEVFPYSPVGYP
jgi:hypothetical protein